MRLRWKILLPAVGLVLFSLGSYESFAHTWFPHGRYFWWSSIRLDSDPLGKRTPTPPNNCESGEPDCIALEPAYIWIDPGLLTTILLVSALPAFLLGAAIVGGLGRVGINQIWSFMISTPLLIGAWFYVVGRIIDRWRAKRAAKTA